MRILNKNKTSPDKKQLNENIQQNKKNSNKLDIRATNESYNNEQLIEFHLDDEEPQSINAKIKLDQFSIQIQQINQYQRNQNSVHLIKKKLISQENEGWVNQELPNHYLYSVHKNNKNNNKKNQNRVSSASHTSMRQTLKVKQQNKKKYSFNNNSSPQNRINLSFNNFPVKMQTIHETQYSKQILNKVKNTNRNRPITANYNNNYKNRSQNIGISQKVLTLFDKQNPKPLNETVRIHSTKQIQNKKNVSLNFKDKQKFLKTFSFHSNKKNSKKSQSKESHKSKQQNKDTINQSNLLQLHQNQITIQNHKKHIRTHSQPFNYTTKQNNYLKNQNHNEVNLKTEGIYAKNQKFGPFSQRKNRIMTQKRKILNKKIKSHHNLVSTQPNQQSIEYNTTKQDLNEGKNISKIELCTEQQERPYSRNNRTSEQRLREDKNPHIKKPSSNNLQQDFSLLISMLKQQSQNVFGGQLHNYITHMKNNYLYNNYYHSQTINKNIKSHKPNNKNKKSQKSSLNNTQTSFNNTHTSFSNTNKDTDLNKTLRYSDKKFIINQSNIQNEKIKSLLNDNQVVMNNTSKHYTPFSSSKYKDKDNAFLKSSTSSFKK